MITSEHTLAPSVGRYYQYVSTDANLNYAESMGITRNIQAETFMIGSGCVGVDCNLDLQNGSVPRWGLGGGGVGVCSSITTPSARRRTASHGEEGGVSYCPAN